MVVSGNVFSSDEVPCLDSLMWASDPQQQRGLSSIEELLTCRLNSSSML